MKTTRFYGFGFTAAAAVLLLAQPVCAQFTPYANQQSPVYQPHGQQPAFGQQAPIGQQPAYAQQAPIGHQPTYGQQAPIGQQAAYSQLSTVYGQQQVYGPQNATAQVPTAPVPVPTGYRVPQGDAPRVAWNDPNAAGAGYASTPVAPAPVATSALAPAPATSYANGACVTGNCQTGAGGGYCGDVGYNTYGCGYGLGGRHQQGNCGYSCGCGCCQNSGWFGGVYGLLMERDRGPRIPLVFLGDGTLVAGDYPSSSAVVLDTRNVDIGYQGGFEARLGRWFGMQNCGCSCGPKCGLEGVYWGLFEDDATATYTDGGTLGVPPTARLYSMLDPRGLEYDPGTGYRPVRDYWDYAPPVQPDVGDPIRIDLARARSTFEIHNIEVNFLKVCCGAPAGCCGGGGYGGGSGLGARMRNRMGRGQSACDSGCDAGCSCCPTPSRFSCTGICGFRYLRMDESFMYGVDFRNTVTAATGFMNYWADVENDLYGFQVGCRGLYRLGACGKWGVNLTSNVGIYGNDVEVRQYMDSPTGDVRFISTAENFDVTATKTDVSVLGEMRLGLSYQHNCRCRIYGGWRVIGITGVALATNQAPSAFIDAAHVANYINTNGSLILHGLQAGVEFNY